MARIVQYFTYCGYAVYAQPEAATLFNQAFVWDNRYCELDTIVSPKLPHCLLEIENVVEDETITFPPFLNVIEELTIPPIITLNISKRK